MSRTPGASPLAIRRVFRHRVVAAFRWKRWEAGRRGSSIRYEMRAPVGAYTRPSQPPRVGRCVLDDAQIAPTERRAKVRSDVLDVVQTIGVVVATLVSAYAVASAETDRRRDARRARIERVLDAALALAEAAIRVQEIQGQGAQFQIARLRLRAALEIVGIKGFEHTELMARESASAADVAEQSKQAILELGARLEEVAPRPLWRRQPEIDFRDAARPRS